MRPNQETRKWEAKRPARSSEGRRSRVETSQGSQGPGVWKWERGCFQFISSDVAKYQFLYCKVPENCGASYGSFKYLGARGWINQTDPF